MTLYDYLNLMEHGEEVSVTDRDYNIANIYFYANHNPSDKFCVEINNLSKLFTITKILHGGTILVNFSEVIENKIEKLEEADLFVDCDIDSIMDSLEYVISGNVPDSWIKKFIEALK